MGKAQENKQHKEKKLLEAAYDLFIDKGTLQTSIDDIVKKAGLAKGTFYLYFKDKNDISERLIKGKAAQLFGEAAGHVRAQQSEVDGVEFLRRVIDYIIGKLAQDKRLMQFLHKNLSFGVFKNLTINPTDDDQNTVLDMIKQNFTRSGLVLDNPDMTIFMIIELVSGTCYNAIVFEQPMNIEQCRPYLFEAMKCLVLQGVTA